jgi:hypothetical protein
MLKAMMAGKSLGQWWHENRDRTGETVYQASQIKRRRRTRAQGEQLDEQIFEVLASDHPQSVRLAAGPITQRTIAADAEGSGI